MVLTSSKSIEDYLKALYILSRNGTLISTTEIAEYFKIAPASVTEMLKKLARKGYVKYSPYHGASLTSKGFQTAEKMARKHRLLERFLHDVLRIKKDKVHLEADEMEHALSDDAEESLCRFLNHPDKCPDDDKIIPACNLPFSSCEECVEVHRKGLEEVGKRDQNLVSICSLKEGDQGKISFHTGGTQGPPEASGHGLDTWHQREHRKSRAAQGSDRSWSQRFQSGPRAGHCLKRLHRMRAKTQVAPMTSNDI